MWILVNRPVVGSNPGPPSQISLHFFLHFSKKFSLQKSGKKSVEDPKILLYDNFYMSKILEGPGGGDRAAEVGLFTPGTHQKLGIVAVLPL